MTLDEFTPQAVMQVAVNMREWDYKEIYATRWNNNPADLVADCMFARRFGWIAGLDQPIAVIGALPTHPGNWQVFMFATDEICRIGLPLTKFAKFAIVPALKAVGARRLECKSMKGHRDAQRWLEVLGGKREARLPGYGRNGETFYQYALTV